MGRAEPQPRLYTPEEYFALERESEVRHEYFEGEVFAMAGTSKEHNDLVFNLKTALLPGLRGKSCKVHTENIRTVVRNRAHYTYPDVVVTCDPADRRDSYQVSSPVLIAEVLSPGTADYDRTGKFKQYQQIPSLRHYLLISQAVWSVEWLRRDELGQWIYTLLNEPADVLEIPDLELRLPLAELYEDTNVAPLRLTPPVNPEPPA